MSQSTCIVCTKEDASLCKQCESAAYCSKDCQKADWPSHKLLCKSFKDFSDEKRPSPGHVRVLSFREDGEAPELRWLETDNWSLWKSVKSLIYESTSAEQDKQMRRNGYDPQASESTATGENPRLKMQSYNGQV